MVGGGRTWYDESVAHVGPDARPRACQGVARSAIECGRRTAAAHRRPADQLTHVADSMTEWTAHVRVDGVASGGDGGSDRRAEVAQEADDDHDGVRHRREDPSIEEYACGTKASAEYSASGDDAVAQGVAEAMAQQPAAVVGRVLEELP